VAAKPTTPEKTSTVPTPKPEAKQALPKSLVMALPVSVEIMQHLRAIEKLLPTLERQAKASEKGGAIAMARAFVVMHRMRDAIRSGEGKDKSVFKPFMELYERYNKAVLPKMLEDEGVTNIPLAEGFRVQMSSPFYASVKKGMQNAAYEWLAANGLEDLIKSTVNSSSLASALKELSSRRTSSRRCRW
jgi:hypothetical protein